MAKIALFPLDRSSAGFFRMREPARVAQEQGLDVTVYEKFYFHLNREKQAVTEVMRDEEGNYLEADVVVFQTPALRYMPQAIEMIQERGIRVVVEVDDNYSNIPPINPTWLEYNWKESPYSKDAILESCKLADQVIVSCDPLKTVYGGTTLPNCVPERALKFRERKGDQIGWAGGAMHHGDFEVCGGEIAKIVREKAPMKIYAPHPDQIARRLGIPDHYEAGEFKSVGEHFGIDFDIGIIPVKPGPFSLGKSWLKALEYSARAIPFAASSEPPYIAWWEQTEGSFPLCAKRRHWKVVKDLMDPEYYAQVQHDIYETAKKWTYEKQLDRWVEVWTG